MFNRQIPAVEKHAATAQFCTLIVYILQGVYKRFDLAIPKALLIFLVTVNFAFALWAAYRTYRERKDFKTTGRVVLGTFLTAAIAAGLFIFILYL